MKNLFARFERATKNIQIEPTNECSEKPVPGRVSYSQTGEDLIMSFICDALGITNPSYLDVGAYHPTELNNTYYFYKRGSTGINIEPNPKAMEEFIRLRGRDKNLNIGLASSAGSMVYYEFDAPTLNTFSEQEAQSYQSKGHQVLRTVEIEVDTVQNVLQAAGFSTFPQLLNLDVEGLELPILQSINLETDGPLIVCLETLDYDPRLGQGKKKHDLIDHLTDRNYRVFADTHINTIFTRKDMF